MKIEELEGFFFGDRMFFFDVIFWVIVLFLLVFCLSFVVN